MIRAGKDGADAVLIETMSDTYEIKAAVLAAKENCDLPIYVTMILMKKAAYLRVQTSKPPLRCWRGLALTQ